MVRHHRSRSPSPWCLREVVGSAVQALGDRCVCMNKPPKYRSLNACNTGGVALMHNW